MWGFSAADLAVAALEGVADRLRGSDAGLFAGVCRWGVGGLAGEADAAEVGAEGGRVLPLLHVRGEDGAADLPGGEGERLEVGALGSLGGLDREAELLSEA